MQLTYTVEISMQVGIKISWICLAIQELPTTDAIQTFTVLFNMFIYDRDAGVDCTISKLVMILKWKVLLTPSRDEKP